MGAAVEPVDGFYAVLRLVGRFWTWFLFKAVTARHVERVPPAGPVLLCINHPNNLIDSLLVAAVVPRKVHYLASASLFRNALLARFLARAGAIPVYRRQDDPERTDRNVEAFAACGRALVAGRVVAIYPEGTTHAEARVQRIKTGAARIALEFEVGRSEGPVSAPAGLALIPVGLTFEARKAFRGQVLVAFGTPIPLAPHIARFHASPIEAVALLTDAIQQAMEAQIVHVDRIDTEAVVRAVETLYRDDLVRALRTERGLAPEAIDVFRLSRTIAEAVAHFRTTEPERVERIWQRIRSYRAHLDAYHVRDHAVRGRLPGAEVQRRLRVSWQAVAGLPAFAYGALVNALPYLLPRWLARRTARKETDYATTRLLASIVAFPLFWGLEIWLVWRLAGAIWAGAFAVSLPLSGVLAYHYLRGLDRLAARTRFAALAVTRRHAATRLLAERSEILADLEKAKIDFLAATHPGASDDAEGRRASRGPETARRLPLPGGPQ